MRSPELISRRAIAKLYEKAVTWELSALSLSELAIKRSCGKFDMDQTRIAASLSELRIRVLPYTIHHAWQMFGLPLHHKDPFDRQIIAQAIAEDIAIVTPDKAFRAYRGIEIIW